MAMTITVPSDEQTDSTDTAIVMPEQPQIIKPTVAEVDEFANINISAIIAKQTKEYDKVCGKLESFVVDIEEEDLPMTPVWHTGLPVMDICVGGGFPQERMSYAWGGTGTGKSTLFLEACHHNFLRNAYLGNPDKYRFVFMDSEEGEAKNWMDRIGVNFPYKYDIPKSIESIGKYLPALRKEFPKQELVVIWDSVAATGTENSTGRADVARPVTDMLRNIKLHDLRITFLVVNQHREKTDQYAPAVPPAGNALRHKSHLTLNAPSVAKSPFWKDKRHGRSVAWKTQKARDGFNDVEFRMEMTYFSGFDVALTMISIMRDLQILKRRVDEFTFDIDEELSFKTGDKESKTEYTLLAKDLMEVIPPVREISGMKDMYNFMFDKESEQYWRFGLRFFAYTMYRPYFVINEDKFRPHFETLMQSIEKYYFDNWNLFVRTIPTRIKF